MKRTYIIGIAAITLLFTAACNKFVDTPIPTNSIVPQAVFSNDVTALSALRGAYASVENSVGELSANTDLFGDDLYNPNAGGILLDAQENTYSPNTNFQYFDNYYKAIYVANSMIEGVDGSKALTPATAQQIKGESLFLRAFCHFLLMDLYGTPPLITATDVQVSSVVGNTPRPEMYAAIIGDLQQAYTLLADDYPSEDRARANKAVVSAFLAKVYLYHQQWREAETEATRQITNTAYSMPSDLGAVFVNGSPETIWQLWSQDGFTTQAATYVPYDPTNVVYTLRPGLLQAFEPGDKRKDAWAKEGEGNSAGLFYPYKYHAVASGGTVEYTVQFRLAEQYLIRAEARAHLQNISGAMDDVNVVRLRAGLGPVTAGSASDALLKIEQERRVELMTENGSRWFDLTRTGRADFWLKAQKPATWQPRDTILPYSTPQLLANHHLQQNPGY